VRPPRRCQGPGTARASLAGGGGPRARRREAGAIPLAPLAARTLAGLAAATLIAGAAWRARSLSAHGAVAAVVVGTVCVAAGWSWGALLIAFFVTATALSRVRRREKERRTGGVVAKGGERDARQVLANGGLFTLAALGSLLAPSPLWGAAGAGAIAAATADTWATEIGTLSRRPPWMITTGRPAAPGTSGAVTVLGTVASVGGALFVAVLALAAGWGAPAALGAVLGGVAGSAADTLLGATLQARRWCDHCDAPTERLVHACGVATRPAGGVAWLDNDGVNLASGVLGLAIGAACAV
jgi:uncharacterized protein (TIGR00297 family)